ncbi:MAG: DNA repair protein RecO [Bacteroides sp.]|nr:DNA repair protein RecO [Bacteroides sp.]
MIHKTVGIVLHTLKYNDSSNIVEMYTEMFGRVSFVVRIPRSKKAAVKSVLFQPLSILEIEIAYRPAASLQRIREARPFPPFRSLPFHPYKSAIALFLAEFLYRAVREETENHPLFAYLRHSILWLDEAPDRFSNFHLVFLMRLSRFLGLYPNLEDYQAGDYFDLLNASFTSSRPTHHSYFIEPEEASRLTQLMRMNYETMYLFGMGRVQRNRFLSVLLDYYRLHLPEFPELKSLSVLQELFG